MAGKSSLTSKGSPVPQKQYKQGMWDRIPFDYFYAALILISVAIVPLIVLFANDIPTAPEEIILFRSPDFQMDFFAYNRSLCLKYTTILLGIVFALDVIRKNLLRGANPELKDFYKRKEFIAYAAFGLFILIAAIIDNTVDYELFGINEANSILSSVPLYFFIFLPLVMIITRKARSNINFFTAAGVLVFFAGIMLTMAFTNFKYITFHGANERYENIYALLGYIIIFLAVIEFADSVKKLKIILFGLMASAAVLGLIGAAQMFGWDFFTTGLAAKLIYGKHYVDGAGINVMFSQSYSLLYNPNTLGMYASMTTALFFFLGLFIPGRSPLKYGLFALAAVCGLALIGSNSAAGLVSFATAIAVGAVFTVLHLRKSSANKNLLLAGGGVAVLILAVILIVPASRNRVGYILDKIFVSGSSYEDQFLKDLRVAGTEVELEALAGVLKVGYLSDDPFVEVFVNGDQFSPYQIDEPDEHGTVKRHYELPGFGYTVVSKLDLLLAFNTHGFIYNFYYTNNKMYYVSHSGRLFDIDTEVPRFGFSGNETFANGRGYLWSRTLPLLKNTLIKGYGVDSFAQAFPQHDILGRVRHIGAPNLLIDKAHNGYLQIAVTTGCLSMLAFVFIIGHYLIRAFRGILARHADDKMLFASMLGAAVGVLAYSISLMSTDSTVGASPVFWGLFGFGAAVLRLNELYIKEEDHE